MASFSKYELGFSLFRQACDVMKHNLGSHVFLLEEAPFRDTSASKDVEHQASRVGNAEENR